MQRWEYLTISYKYGSWSDSLGRTGTFPKAYGPGTADPTSLLNDLGEQGWELSGVACRDPYDVIHLFLKRPRS